MNFFSTIDEGTIHNSVISAISKQLKDKLLSTRISEKIQTEINTNYQKHLIFSSQTLFAVLAGVIEENIPEISVTETNKSEQLNAAFIYREREFEITFNPMSIARDTGLIKILNKKGKIEFIDDFLIACINAATHEIIHYYDMKKKRQKLSYADLERISRKNIVKIESDLSEIEYLNTPEEMMSFSHGVVIDLKLQGYTQDEVLGIINTGVDKEGFKSSKDLTRYIGSKSNLSNWKKFMRYMYDYATKYWEEI